MVNKPLWSPCILTQLYVCMYVCMYTHTLALLMLKVPRLGCLGNKGNIGYGGFRGLELECVLEFIRLGIRGAQQSHGTSSSGLRVDGLGSGTV